MRLILLLPLLSSLATCASTRSAPSPASPIAGVWKTGCMPIGKNGRHGFVTTLTASEKTFTAVSQVYAHNNCDTPTLRTTYRATIAAIGGNGSAIDLDHVVDVIEMTVDSGDVIATYNKPGSGCGFGGGWQSGIPRNVAGRACAPFSFPMAGTRLYERVWIEDDRLRLGSFPIVWVNTSPDRRPASPGALVFQRITA